MAHEPQFDDDRELDRLLAHAVWPQVRPDRLARLETQWRELVRRRQRQARRRWAVAACLLVACCSLTWQFWATERAATPVARSEHGDRGARPSTNRPARASASAAVAPEPSASPREASIARDPSLYEQVLLVGAWSETSNQRHLAERIDAAVEALAQDANANVEESLTTIGRYRLESAALKILQTERGPRWLGAAHLLIHSASARSLPTLVWLSGDARLHEPAVRAMIGLVGLQELARLAQTEPTGSLRRDLLAALLSYPGEEAIELYLLFVADDKLRGDALAVLDTLPDPPPEALLIALNSPRPTVRLAAARALARVPNSEVLARLSRSSVEGIGRQEAMIALLLSPTSEASRLLSQARNDLYQAATVRAAEQQLQMLNHQSGGHLP